MKLIALILCLVAMAGAGFAIHRHVKSTKTAIGTSPVAAKNQLLSNAEKLEALLKKCRDSSKKQDAQLNP
jgi:hypothetical protein